MERQGAAVPGVGGVYTREGRGPSHLPFLGKLSAPGAGGQSQGAALSLSRPCSHLPWADQASPASARVGVAEPGCVAWSSRVSGYQVVGCNMNCGDQGTHGNMGEGWPQML